MHQKRTFRGLDIYDLPGSYSGCSLLGESELLAMEIAIRLCNDVDMPCNLAESMTVE